MHESDVSYLIRQAAYNVHVSLGPGLLESACEAALTYELRSVGLRVQNQVALPMVYKGMQLEVGYRLDSLVEDKVVVELKTVDAVLDVHHMQLLTYLKLSGHKLRPAHKFQRSPHQRGHVPQSQWARRMSFCVPSAKTSASSAVKTPRTPMKLFLLALPLMTLAQDPNTTDETPVDNKLIIYQMLPRLFGNKVALNKTYGTIQENGCGKFNDISDVALAKIKELGVSHVWYTGVIEHATMTPYPGLPADDADVVKGRAGSPYAIRDYYNVDPDLATTPQTRLAEFEALVKRTHAHGLKVLIDFIPNHVARSYKSASKPARVVDLGATDDKTQAFAPNNNFYYVPGQRFVVPAGYQPLGPLPGPREDSKYNELPAKATGNDVFSAAPSVDDWFETIKLNYGVDYQHGRQTHFEPVPDTWVKMKDILVFWAKKNVDGFRCDMAEMVPVEFWAWVIPQIKKVKPGILFIGEAYNPKEYGTYFTKGQFDFLYDKVGLYDALRRLMRQEGSTDDITHVWKTESRGFSSHMLRFLENHDEQRIASREFATDPRRAIPAMTVSATLASGPVMLYMGQDVGEPAHGVAGFNTGDGRTTLFDYWSMPEHQKWMNQGKFDGAKLSPAQKQLHDFYKRLLTLAGSSEAIRRGRFYELQDANNLSKEYDQRKLYSFVRYTEGQKVLVVVNFSDSQTYHPTLLIPDDVMKRMGLDPQHVHTYRDLLSGSAAQPNLSLTLAPLSAVVLEIKP